MKIGLNEYEHKAGDCFFEKIATLDGSCGDPRCKGFRDGYLDAKYLQFRSMIALSDNAPFYADAYYDGQSAWINGIR